MTTATKEPAVKKSAARRSTVPDPWDMAANDDHRIRGMSQKVDDPALLTVYYNHIDVFPSAVIGLAYNPRSNPEWLDEFAHYDLADDMVRQAVASNPATSEATLRYLTDETEQTNFRFREYVDGPTCLAASVASNPSAPADLLTRFSTHDSYGVRTLVALNPSTPIPVLLRMGARDKRAGVRKAALAKELKLRAWVRNNHPELADLSLQDAALSLNPARRYNKGKRHRTA